MVFNKVFFFFYNNFMGFRSRLRCKQATPLPHGGNLSLRPITPDDCAIVTLSSPEKALEGETCCVCLSSMGNKDGDRDKGVGTSTSVLPCLHEFHKVCVDRWFEECRRTCPICRYSMEGGGSHEDGTNQILTDEMVIWFSSFHTSGF
ncbi:E3 ubiquitin-protein ligase RNF167-like [Benincasa hispida]|uniref:E3 ubiquitin-protein ligase RNF167-like n=1 Tax=Benincasa hispida TaxID=102211 RepID=UPI0018FFD4D8|nr:E3 ubiquitin-protein ligase RNF167-like [Benincasa hispida]